MNHISVYLIFLSLMMLGCVSVNLTPSKASKATDVKFASPPPPFHKIENPTVDLAWQNKNNGNTIAFLSECNLKIDIPLQMMETESLAALSQLKVLKSENVEFNDREAKIILAEGQVDGIWIMLKLQLLKKNGCNYLFSYVGRKKFFDTDLFTYQSFLNDFKAP